MKQIPIAATLFCMFVTFTHASPAINQMGLTTNLKPDIASKGMRVHTASVSAGIKVLNASDAKNKQNGKCVYDMTYNSTNIGKSKAGRHMNIIRRNGKIVMRHPQLELKAGKRQHHTFEIALAEGVNTLKLNLDNGDMVSESIENNNATTLKVRVVGSCMSLSGQGGSTSTINIKKQQPKIDRSNESEYRYLGTRRYQ